MNKPIKRTGTGTGNKGLDWIIVIGMLLAFPKTADLLSLFSPQWLNNIFGFDVSMIYGAACAIMVEGVVLFLHFDRRAHRVTSAQTVKWIMIGISFVCQIFDGYVITDALNQMTPPMRFALTVLVPALPLIIAVLVSMIGALPDEDQPVRRVGLKERLPDLKKIWEGEPEYEEKVEQTNLPAPQNPPAPVPTPSPAPNGAKANAVNPTNRQP